MSERVTVINKKSPFLIVAPHGPCDIGSDTLADYTADFLQCSAVINRGFRKSDTVDVINDLADCNRVDHAKQPVVFDEFLMPILKIKNRVTGNSTSYGYSTRMFTTKPKHLFVFYIHGVGDNIHKKANELVGVIVGSGRGDKKDSLTCQNWKKNLFINKWREHSTNYGDVYEGKGGGNYAGRSSNNLNQYFRKHEMDRTVDSLQLEFPYCHRKSENDCKRTASILAQVISEFIDRTSYDKSPQSKFI